MIYPRWKNPVQYPNIAVGGWRGGYTMGAYDPTDYEEDALVNAALAQKGINGAVTVGNNGDVNILTQPLKDALYNLPDYDRVMNTDGATSIFQLDDDEKIYALYVSANAINDAEKSDAAEAMINKGISDATNTVIPDMDTLVDKLFKAYEDYFAAHYDEDAGKQQAQQGGVAVATTVSKTGKIRKAGVKRAQIHKPAWQKTALIAGGVVGVGALLFWLLGKNKRW